MVSKERSPSSSGFTIVELLIVIVVIGILAAIVIVAFNGIQDRARTTQRNSDTGILLKAISAARITKDAPLKDVTGSTYSLGNCISAANNSAATEPKDLPKTHTCWIRYYSNLDAIGAAAGMNLESLKKGDARGNPYMWDENEGEGTTDPLCRTDSGIQYFTGNGVTTAAVTAIPKYYPAC